MHPLDTPIWNSLHGGWAALAQGDAQVVRLDPDHRLPELPNYQMSLALREGANSVAKALGEHVAASFHAIAQQGMRVFA